jgi:hypothetical protein
MSAKSEIDLQALAADWQAPEAPASPAERIREHVRRRGRMFTMWAAVEVVIGTVFLTFLGHRAVTHPDPIEKLAMGLLAAITAAAMAFGLWNWRGTLGSSAEDTRTFVALSAERSRRLARAVRAGWVLLAAQVAVFVPWVSHRLYGDGRPPSSEIELFAWGYLTVITALAVVFLLALQSWSRRDAAAFDEIRRELDE